MKVGEVSRAIITALKDSHTAGDFVLILCLLHRFGTHSKRGQLELIPEEERTGTHEKPETPEEHEAIMEWLLKNRMLNPNSRRNIFPLSGLLYCEKCGSRMRFRVGENKK